MTLTVRSVRYVGFGVLIEQILRDSNLMLIEPQENVSLSVINWENGSWWYLPIYGVLKSYDVQ